MSQWTTDIKCPQCKRDTPQLPFHQVTLVPGYKKKTVFDAWNDYHSIPIRVWLPLHHLHHTLWPLLIPDNPTGIHSITGRLRQVIQQNRLWLPQQSQMHQWHPGRQFFQACRWLDLCGHNGIILNPDKFKFRADCVICQLWNHNRQCKTLSEISASHHRLTHTKKYYRHPVLVWPHESSQLLHIYDRQNETFQGTPQTILAVLLGWPTTEPIWQIKKGHHWQNQRGNCHFQQELQNLSHDWLE